MERVKLTPEQAEVLERLKESHSKVVLVRSHYVGTNWYLHQTKGTGLDRLDLDTFIRALYIGYEIEKPFKVGDWVKYTSFNRTFYGQIEKINEFGSAEAHWSDGKYGGMPLPRLESMTPEEITAEKERRKWAAIGRKVGEYKTNDIVYHEKYGYGVYVHGQMIEPFNQEKYSGWHDVKAKELKLICPVEHRFDMKEAE
jgi:hypothetical protein